MIKIDYSGIINTAIKAIVVSIILGIVTGAVAIVWNIVWTGVTTVDKRISDTEIRLTSAIEILADEISTLREELNTRPPAEVAYEMHMIDTTHILPIPEMTLPVPNQQRILERIDTRQQTKY